MFSYLIYTTYQYLIFFNEGKEIDVNIQGWLMNGITGKSLIYPTLKLGRASCTVGQPQSDRL